MRRPAIVLLAALLASCSAPAATRESASTTPSLSAMPTPSADVPDPSVTAVPASPTPEGATALVGQLAYVAGFDPQIHLLDLGTGESRQLTELRPEHAELTASGPMQPALSCAFGPSALTWSPSGEHLAFSYGGCDSVVYVVDLDGELRRIGDGRGPAWSPDGTRLVHGVNVPYSPCGAGCLPDPDPGAWDLRIVALAEDGESRPLTVDGSTAGAGSPTWSPDGSTIAYSAPPPPGGSQQEAFSATYLVDATGGEPRLVGTGIHPMGWLPDGHLLVTKEGDGSVHAVEVNNAVSTQVGPPQTATASPDGTLTVAWVTDSAAGDSRAVMLDAAGQTLADFGGQAVAWAPDSSALAAVDGLSILIVGRDGSLLGSYPIEPEGGVGSASWRPDS